MVHPDEYNSESSAKSELYNGDMFGESLSSLGLDGYSLGLGGDIEEREFVMCHTGKWSSPMYSKDEICCVYEVYEGERIDLQTGMLLSDILDERPNKITNRSGDPVPSLKGEYLKVSECLVKTRDGVDYVNPSSKSYWIPVEWVRKNVVYNPDETVLEA